MSIEKRVEKLRCLITCMKCEVSGKVCDENCSTQYDAGNMGEIIENLEEIAKALEHKCKDCKWWKDSDGVYRRGVGAESKCPINNVSVNHGFGYCYMFEPQERSE